MTRVEYLFIYWVGGIIWNFIISAILSIGEATGSDHTEGLGQGVWMELIKSSFCGK